MNSFSRFANRYFSTMKSRGWLFVAFLLMYISISASYIFMQKDSLVERFENYNSKIGLESTLIEAELVLARLYGALMIGAENDTRDAILERMHQEFSLLNRLNAEIQQVYPAEGAKFEQLLLKLASTAQTPSQQNFIQLNTLLNEFSYSVQALSEENQVLRKSAIGNLITDSNELALLALYLGLFGILLSGFIASVFFTRLGQDLVRLRDWLLQLSSSKDVPILLNRRNDELGTVFEKTSELAHALAQRETQVVIERQKRIFQKKDATVRNMLAGLLHELGNPMASLSTVLRNRDSSHESDMHRSIIDDSLTRVENIISDLNQWELSEQADQDIFCLNDRISQFAKLMKYDERWQEAQIELSLGEQLPALKLPGRDVQDLISILMEVMLENSKDCRRSEIDISTRLDGQDVVLALTETKQAEVHMCFKGGRRCPKFGQSDEDLDINLLAAKAIAGRIGARLEVGRSQLSTSISLTIATA